MAPVGRGAPRRLPPARDLTAVITGRNPVDSGSGAADPWVVPGGWLTCAAVLVGVAFASVPAFAADESCPEEARAALCETNKQASRWAALPIVSYQPETSWAFGGFVQLYFDSPRSKGATGEKPRRSSLALVTLVSLKKQFVVELDPTLYFDNGRWRVSATLGAAYFPDTFYAIGPDSPASSREDFTARIVNVVPTLERRLLSHLYVGWNAELGIAKLVRAEPGGALASGRVPGSHGGRVLGMGPVIAWDDRDRESAPRRGGRYEFSMRTFPRWFGMDYGFSRVKIDLRHYVSIAEGHVLAVQLYTRHAGGSVPFYRMSHLAGEGRMRGFLESRYVDRHTVSAQVEYRAHLFWRLGATAFVASGAVAPRLADFATRNVRYAGGGGLRLAVNEADGVNLRLDGAAASDGEVNAYVNIGEAF